MMYTIEILVSLSFFAIFGVINTFSRIYQTSYWDAKSDLGYVARSVGSHIFIGSITLVGFGISAIFNVGRTGTAILLLIALSIPTAALVGKKIEIALRTTVRDRMADAGVVTDSFDTPDESADRDQAQADNESSQPVLARIAYKIGNPVVSDSRFRKLAHAGIGGLIASPFAAGILIDQPILLGGWLLIAPIVGVLDVVSESHGEISDRERPPPDTPNVIVCMIDEVRRDHTSVYGYNRETTPFLERTDNKSVRFTNCISAGVRSGHSIPSLMTGTYSSVHQYGVNTNLKLLSEEFAEHGYVTGAISGNPHINQSRFGEKFDWYLYLHHGKQFLFRVQRIIALFADYIGLRRLPLHYFRADISFINSLTEVFIRRWKNERPFFMFLSYIDVHKPYIRSDDAIESFAAEHGHDITDQLNADTPAAEKELNQWGYDEAIRYTDRNLEELYDFLEKENLLEETVILITSDHGELLGEQDLWGHIDIPYNPLFEVPLIAYTPSLSGRTIDSIVSGAQIPSLLFSLAGIEPSLETRAQWLTELTFEEIKSDDPADDYALVDFYDPAIDTKGYASESTLTGQRLLVSEDWKHYTSVGQSEFYRYDDVFMDEPVAGGNDVPDKTRSDMTEQMEILSAQLDNHSNLESDENPYAEFDDQRIRDQLEDLGYI